MTDTRELLRRAANALIVVDMNDNPTEARWKLAERIREFIEAHNDEYKVIIATQRSPRDQFTPPLVVDIDFDMMFLGPTGEERRNFRNETVDDYLRAHEIGHVDLVGVDVIESDFVGNNFAKVIARYGFSTFGELCQPYDTRRIS